MDNKIEFARPGYAKPLRFIIKNAPNVEKVVAKSRRYRMK
jgi:hypothetical protein